MSEAISVCAGCKERFLQGFPQYALAPGLRRSKCAICGKLRTCCDYRKKEKPAP